MNQRLEHVIVFIAVKLTLGVSFLHTFVEIISKICRIICIFVE